MWSIRVYLKLPLFAVVLNSMLQYVVAQPRRLPTIQSFACYYGRGEVEALSHYPLVLLEAANYSDQEIRHIRRYGAVVIGYVSLGETREEPSQVRDLRPSGSDPALPPYYLDGDKDGRPDRNSGWGSLYVDARSPEWQSKILGHSIPELLEKKRVQGLFLDTLDTVDLYPQTRPGMIQLVQQIRRFYPRIPLVANRGFSMAAELIPEVDAFLFEAFSTHWEAANGRSRLHSAQDLQWVDSVLQKIRDLGGRKGPQVLVLDYADSQDRQVLGTAVTRARDAGLTYSISTGNLDRLPLEGGPGKPKLGR